MGKPPRDRLRISDAPRSSRKVGGHVNGIDRNNRGTVDSFVTSILSSIDAPDALSDDILGSSLVDFMCLDFGDELLYSNVESGPMCTLESPEFEDYSHSAEQNKALQSHVDESIFSDGAYMLPIESKCHDCFREAYDILGSLSFLNMSGAHFTSQPSPGSGSTAENVPLDHILRLNRESSIRLSCLLTCFCARSPYLALLYASIISRMQIWYLQAAECTQGAPWNSAPVLADGLLGNVSPSASIPESPLPWSSSTASTVTTSGAGMSPTTGSTTLAVAPTQMAMGSFNIDDQQVQTALRIQLLLGEIRRAATLIDLFSSRSSSDIDEFTFSGTDSLYKSLSSWLKREHARIVGIMKSKLKEVDDE
jgi:hypothetical protein